MYKNPGLSILAVGRDSNGLTGSEADKSFSSSAGPAFSKHREASSSGSCQGNKWMKKKDREKES